MLDDFGSQGGWPSHPELLDYLANEFVASGWDVKYLVKLMVMSASYRQSSLMDDQLRQKDPENKWLARQSRFRIEAELIRDNALSVSGLLVREIGGQSVKPYQPAGLYRHLNFPKRSYRSDEGDAQFRRGLYTHWQRQFLHPAMKSFDAPAREECTVSRPRSNTPLGALVLLNDPSYVEAARALAALCWQKTNDAAQSAGLGKSDTALCDLFIRELFRSAVSREPSVKEIEVLSNLYTSELEYFTANPAAAAELTGVGISGQQTEIPQTELAAATSLARAVMNLHEFITRN